MDSLHSTVIVVGGGGMGLSTAYRLAKSGHDVRVLEQFKFFHNRGSSHSEHRIIRRTYNDTLYSELMPHAYRLWEELETDSGQKLKYIVGGIEIGPDDDPTLLDIIRINRELNIPSEVMTPAEASKRYPQFHLRPGWLMVYCPENGFLAVDDCIRAHAEQARKHGAILQDEELVLEIKPLAHGAEVRTAKATYTCDKLVLTAGPYVKNLLKQLGLDAPYTIELNQSHWFKVDHPDWFMPDKFPVFIVRHDRDTMGGMYGFPTFRNPGIKVSVHHSNHYIDIDQYDMIPRNDTTERVRTWITEFIPDARGELLKVATCPYDFPPDEHFVLSLHPQYPDIAMANMAGHGYKFASLVGEIMAQLAIDGKTEYDLTGFGVDRFFSETAARRPAIHVDIGRSISSH
ncbi:MAG: N-methyl-L-tryptophan oxidase [Aggregatilineales bacterium]